MQASIGIRGDEAGNHSRTMDQQAIIAVVFNSLVFLLCNCSNIVVFC